MRLRKNNTPRENLFTAFVAVREGHTLRFLKYRRILDRPAPMKRFEQFLNEHFPSWSHVNFYGGISRLYKRRLYNQNNNVKSRY